MIESGPVSNQLNDPEFQLEVRKLITTDVTASKLLNVIQEGVARREGEDITVVKTKVTSMYQEYMLIRERVKEIRNLTIKLKVAKGKRLEEIQARLNSEHIKLRVSLDSFKQELEINLNVDTEQPWSAS